MSAYKTGDRVTATGYGDGAVVRMHDEYRTVVKFDRTDGFHGDKPLIVWNYTLCDA
jgi:hypothetical protein